MPSDSYKDTMVLGNGFVGSILKRQNTSICSIVQFGFDTQSW